MNLFIVVLVVALVGYTLGYYTSMFLWKRVSNSWKWLYFDARKEIDALRIRRGE